MPQADHARRRDDIRTDHGGIDDIRSPAADEPAQRQQGPPQTPGTEVNRIDPVQPGQTCTGRACDGKDGPRPVARPVAHQVYRRPLRAAAVEIGEEEERGGGRRHSIRSLEQEENMMRVKDVVVRVDQPQAVALELRDDGLLAGSRTPDLPPVRRMKPLRWARTQRLVINSASANQIGNETSIDRKLKLGNSEIERKREP